MTRLSSWLRPVDLRGHELRRTASAVAASIQMKFVEPQYNASWHND
jgi:hypothetical protein